MTESQESNPHRGKGSTGYPSHIFQILAGANLVASHLQVPSHNMG